MGLQRGIVPLKNKLGRLYVQRTELNPYKLLEHHGVTNMNWPDAPVTAIRGQSMSRRAGSVVLDLVEGDPDMATFTIPSFISKTHNYLASIAGEFVNFQLLTGERGQPTQYGAAKYGFGWFMCRRGTGTTAIGAIADNAGEGGPMTFETPMTAIMGPYHIDWSLALTAQVAHASMTQVAKGVYALMALKDDSPAYRVLPGEVGMVVCDSAVDPAFAPIGFWRDGLAGTMQLCAANPFVTGRGCTDVVGFGDKLAPRFIVSAESVAATPPGVSYTEDYGVTWTPSTFSPVGVNVDEVTRLWIVHAGAVYGVGGQAGSSKLFYSIDGGASFVVTNPGLAQPLKDICVMGNGTGYMVGASNVIAKITDFNIVSTLTGPAGGAGDNLLCVAVKPSTGTVFIGNAAGELYTSQDEGVTWAVATTRIQGVVPTAINLIRFDPECGEFGYMEVTTATPARVKLRSTDGGNSWKQYDLGAPAGANIASNACHVVGPNHVVFAGALYNSLASVLLGQSLFDGSRLT